MLGQEQAVLADARWVVRRRTLLKRIATLGGFSSVVLADSRLAARDSLRSTPTSSISLLKTRTIRFGGRSEGAQAWALAWSPNGRRLAIADNADKVFVFDTLDWREVCRFGRGSAPSGSTLAFLSDTRIITLAAHNDIGGSWIFAIHDTETGRVVERVSRPSTLAKGSVTALVVTPTRDYLVTVVSGRETVAAAFETTSWTFLHQLALPERSRPRIVAAGPPNRVAINVLPPGASTLEQAIYIFDVASNAVTARLSGHIPGVESIAWSPDGRLIASGATGYRRRGGTEWIRNEDPIRIWNSDTGEMVTSFVGFFEEVHRTAWHPPGKVFATVGGKGKSEYGYALRIWSPSKRQMLLEYKPDGVPLITELSFQPTTGHLVLARDGELQVYAVNGLE